jgi:hypothetical protein
LQSGLAEREPPKTLRAVIIYDDLDAGRHAWRILSDITRSFGSAVVVRPFPWSFELLADTDWREAAHHDAADADILIFATSDRLSLPEVIERWAGTVIRQKQGTPAAVVALFGPQENPDDRDSMRLQTMERMTRDAGLHFFAPDREPSAFYPQ